MTSILDRYIIREYLKVFALCVSGLALVFLLIEITDKLKFYFAHNPSTFLMFKYFVVKTPGYFFYVVPLGMLMGGMLSLMMMAKNSEIIAMQANGIDALGVARPVLLLGIIGSALLFVANESIIPWSNRRSEEIQDEIIHKRPSQTVIRRDQIWMRMPGQITHVKKFVPSNRSLESITIVRWNGAYDFMERIYADKAIWRNNRWMMYGVNVTRRDPDGHFSVKAYPWMVGPLEKPPEDFGRVERLAQEMNLWELGDYIKKLREEGYRPTRYLVDWHDKLAFPLVCLIMAALGAPFAIKTSPRSGGVALGLALTIAIAFSYWIVRTLFIALGHGGYLPPVVAAWAANVIFGLAAAIMLLHTDT